MAKYTKNQIKRMAKVVLYHKKMNNEKYYDFVKEFSYKSGLSLYRTTEMIKELER